MQRIRLILATACLAATTAVHGRSAHPDNASQAATSKRASIPDEAIRLSRIIYPQDKVLELRLKVYDSTVAAEFTRDPQKAALFAKYPGLLEAVISAGRLVLQKHSVALAPERQQRFALFFAEKFSPTEIDQLISFYSGPTGAKLLAGLYLGANVERQITALPSNQDNNLTAQQANDLNRVVAAQLREKFNAEDRKALAAYEATSVYGKLWQLKTEFHSLLARTAIDPTLDADMGEAVQATITTYVAQHGTR